MRATSDRAFVWVWLPGQAKPVAAGVLQRRPGGLLRFGYGQSYLARADAISLWEQNSRWKTGGSNPTRRRRSRGVCATPRRTCGAGGSILNRIIGNPSRDLDPDDADTMTYLLESGSDRCRPKAILRAGERQSSETSLAKPRSQWPEQDVSGAPHATV